MLPANQKRFWNVLKYGYDRNEVLKTNPDIMRAIKISQRVGRIIEPLSNFIFALAKRRIDGANYVHLTYNDDLVQESVKFMLIAVPPAITKDNRWAYSASHTPPASAMPGSIYFDMNTEKMRIFDGTSWKVVV